MTKENEVLVDNLEEAHFNVHGWTDIRDDILLRDGTFKYATWVPKGVGIVRLRCDEKLHPVQGGNSCEGDYLYERRSDYYVYNQERIEVVALNGDSIDDIGRRAEPFLVDGYVKRIGYIFEKLDDNLYKQKRICILYRAKRNIVQPGS